MAGVNIIRVLIVDESFFMRKLLREMLLTDNGIEVVGEAKDGTEAVGIALKLAPDVITMDYHMPTMNGAEAARRILQASPEKKPAIIMISAYTREGVEETIDCLRAGAFDFIQKPSGELSLDIDTIKDDILFKIHGAMRARIRSFGPLKRISADTVFVATSGHTSRAIVVIGASTGGPPIVENIVSSLPKNFSTPVVVIQHMPKYFTKTFANRLDKVCHMPVSEATEGTMIRRGAIVVAPGDSDLLFEKNGSGETGNVTAQPRIALDVPGPHPSIDVTMKSAAHLYGQEVIGVILSGMGEDGTEGARAIKKAGGYVIVQEPSTTVVDSMPQSVIHEGLVDEVLAPERISARIQELVMRPL